MNQHKSPDNIGCSPNQIEPLLPSVRSGRDLVVVSGYYGFDNLGDEAIAEELTRELKRLVRPEHIVVLSASPEATARTFGVRSEARLSPASLIRLVLRTRLFVSGGGGLFQNRKSVGSIVYYGGLMAVFKAFGAAVLVYAQGLGPLSGSLAQCLTRLAMRLADVIMVRDTTSKELLDRWSIPATRTADPVWCLERSPLPAALASQLESLRTAGSGRLLVGLSLRPDPCFGDEHLAVLAESLAKALPPDSVVLPLALQPAQDAPLLARLGTLLSDSGCQLCFLPTGELTLPSQWLTLIGSCQLVVGMRLHALVMALASGCPVVGLAYDPKVTAVLTEFEQPTLNLAKQVRADHWTNAIRMALDERCELSERAVRKSESAKDLACQNFSQLARILAMQSDC